MVKEETVESRWEAAPAAALVIVLQLVLALVSLERGWTLWGLPWWVWLLAVVPEVVLLLALVLESPRRSLERMGRRGSAAVTLLAVISVANGAALIALLGSLVTGEEQKGGELLLKGRGDLGNERDRVRPLVLGARPGRPDQEA